MKTSKLWIRNTSRYPDAEVWPLIKAAHESVERSVGPGKTMPRIIVKLTNTRHSYCGRASWRETERDKKDWHAVIEWRRIIVRIGKPDRFPRPVRYPKFKGDMPEFECRTYREAIVMVTAHEMEHCLGASGRKDGEFRCELSAWDAIEYYRKHQTEVDGEIESAMAKKAQRSALQKAPSFVTFKKLEAARAMAAKWARKQKLATNKLRKYQRAVKRLEQRHHELSCAEEPQQQAATSGQ